MLQDPALITAIGAAIAALLTAWAGYRKTTAEIVMMREQVQRVEGRLRHETTPNHGSSLRDAIDTNTSRMADIGRDIARLADAGNIHQEWANDEVARVHSRIDHTHNRIDRIENHT